MVDADSSQPGLFPQAVGERLRSAREKAGLDLNDVATRTRVPMRHLEAIERSEYSSLPSITYAIGFGRAYARAVGMDEVAVAHDLRSELGRAAPDAHEAIPYQPADPSRVPSRMLAWTAAALVVVFVVVYSGWRNGWFGDRDATPSAETAAQPAPSPAPASAAPTAAPPPLAGQVVLTATAPVWLRIYDKNKTRLLEKEMAAGERYEVPATANEPMILTGRPDALKVTVNGSAVAPLGPPERTIADVGISAAALAARATAPAADNATAAQ